VDRIRLSLLGFGLIGGSIARALRATGAARTVSGPVGDFEITAWSPSGGGPREALAGGIVDRASASMEDAVADADVVVLAAPPLACLEMLDALAGPLRAHLPPTATVSDVASTKAAIVRRADALGLRFVGGHPMAGREVSGFGAALADLFNARPWVIVQGRASGPADVALVERLAVACGARPVRMTADDHDRAVAGISHLPFVTALALVEAVVGRSGGTARADWPGSRELAATAWRDMTRLARGDPAMAAGIIATNAPALRLRLTELRDVLDAWLAEIADETRVDPAALERRISEIRDRLE
jgi:prephenate dehydrogenase